MKTIKAQYKKIRKKWNAVSEWRYTAVAATLVFFFVLSVVPFTFWLTLLFGNFWNGTEEIFSLRALSELKEPVAFLLRNARAATAEVSVLLALISLYSASNFFYQLRRTGEYLYDYAGKKSGFKTRFFAVLLTLGTMFLLVLITAFILGMVIFFRHFLPELLAEICTFFSLLLAAFFVCCLLNAYLCPFRVRFKDVAFGSLMTAELWGGATLLFSAYLRVSNLEKLYGAVTAAMVFVAWVYVMMLCFVAGVACNRRRIAGKKKEK